LYFHHFHFAVIDLEQREDAAKNEKENEEMAAKNLQAEVSHVLVMMMTMMILYLLEIETMNLFYIYYKINDLKKMINLEVTCMNNKSVFQKRFLMDLLSATRT